MIRRLERGGFPHNAVAHPLLVLCSPVGRWLHERTQPVVPTFYARHRQRVDGWPRFYLGRARHDHPLTDLGRCLAGAIGLRRLR